MKRKKSQIIDQKEPVGFSGMTGNSVMSGSFSKEVKISEIVEDIKTGKFKALVDDIRKIEDKESRNEKKKELGIFTLGISTDLSRRSDKFEHSEYILLDFDHVGDENAVEMKKDEIEDDPEVCMVFISPSGDGLKVAYRLSEKITDASQFTTVYKAVSESKSSKYDIDADSTSDCLRLCYYSYDKTIYYKPDSVVINVHKLNYKTASVIAQKDRKATSRTKKAKKSKSKINSQQPSLEANIQSSNNNINIEVINHLKNHKITYDEWISVGFYLCSQVNGEGLFIDLTCENKHFNDSEDVALMKYQELKDSYDPDKNPPTLSRLMVIATKYDFKSTSFFKINPAGRCIISNVKFYEEFIPSLGVFNLKNKLVLLKDNIIKYINKEELKILVRNQIKLLDIKEKDKSTLLDAIINKDKTLYDAERLIYITEANINPLKDEKDVINMIFENCWVSVTKDEVITKPLSELDKPFFIDQQVALNFSKMDLDPDFCFKKFLDNITSTYENNEWKKDSYRLESLETAIGYLLHNYKNPSKGKAVIFIDEIDEDSMGLEANGGTGKSLLTTAISKMLKTVTVQGKSIQSDDKFRYQQVDLATRLIDVSDIKANFNFENFYNEITDKLEVNRKHLPAYTITFKDSPKFLISTNRVLGNDDISSMRRKFEVVFNHYYGLNITPDSEFDHLFFTDWDEAQWNCFISIMINCAQTYLSKGLVQVKNSSYYRIMLARTSRTFTEFADTFKLDTKYDKRVQREEFVKSFPVNFNITPHKFTKFLKAYAEAKKANFETQESNGHSYFTFIKRSEQRQLDRRTFIDNTGIFDDEY